MEPDNPLLDRFILSRARRSSPNICFVPTASGDSPSYAERFYAAFAEHDCHPTDLQLFKRTVSNLEAFVLAQDVIYVGAGNVANLLAVWRIHGLDQILRQACERSIVLCGISAGMNCWFEQSLTDSFDLNQLRVLNDGPRTPAGQRLPALRR